MGIHIFYFFNISCVSFAGQTRKTWWIVIIKMMMMIMIMMILVMIVIDEQTNISLCIFLYDSEMLLLFLNIFS